MRRNNAPCPPNHPNFSPQSQKRRQEERRQINLEIHIISRRKFPNPATTKRSSPRAAAPPPVPAFLLSCIPSNRLQASETSPTKGETAKGGLKPIPARTHSPGSPTYSPHLQKKEKKRNALSTRGDGEQRQRLLARRRGFSAGTRAYLRARTGASSWASAAASSRPGAWFEPSRWAPRAALAVAGDGFDSELSGGRAGRRWVFFSLREGKGGEMAKRKDVRRFYN